MLAYAGPNQSALTLMIVDRLEHLLGRNQQMCHFPHRHLKVHLGKLEQSVACVSMFYAHSSIAWVGLPLEESRHSHLRPAPVGAKVAPILARRGYPWAAHESQAQQRH